MITKHFINLNQHAMKNLTLKVAVVALAMFAGFGANAQTPWTAAGFATRGDYTRTDTAAIINNKVTINKSMPFWVYPSVAYNPSYVAPTATKYTPVADIVANVLSSFAWYQSTGTGVMTQANANKNYVELSWNQIGTKKIAVTETPTGGVVCPGKAIRYDIEVIDVPAANISNATTTTYGLNNVMASGCEGDASLTTAININLSNANEEAPFHVNLGYGVYTVDAVDISGNIPNAANILNTGAAGVTDYTASSTVDVFGQDLATTPSASNPIKINASPVVASQAYSVQNSKITVYEFIYNNLNGKISRASDYLAARTGSWTATDYANFSYYPAVAAAQRYYVVVFPKPVTGPIYHIANTFAY